VPSDCDVVFERVSRVRLLHDEDAVVTQRRVDATQDRVRIHLIVDGVEDEDDVERLADVEPRGVAHLETDVGETRAAGFGAGAGDRTFVEVVTTNVDAGKTRAMTTSA